MLPTAPGVTMIPPAVSSQASRTLRAALDACADGCGRLRVHAVREPGSWVEISDRHGRRVQTFRDLTAVSATAVAAFTEAFMAAAGEGVRIQVTLA